MTSHGVTGQLLYLSVVRWEHRYRIPTCNRRVFLGLEKSSMFDQDTKLRPNWPNRAFKPSEWTRHLNMLSGYGDCFGPMRL
jgi:hypothetical protein